MRESDILPGHTEKARQPKSCIQTMNLSSDPGADEADAKLSADFNGQQTRALWL